MILPLVKKEAWESEICNIPLFVTCSYTGEDAKRGADAFALLNDGVEFVREGGFVRFAHDLSLEDRPEIYSVRVLADHIEAGFRDARGAVNAAATISLLLNKKQLTVGEITDYPDSAYRGFMIDMARGLPDATLIKESITYMALAKYNRLHLHLIDAKGPCYRSDALPEYRYTGEGAVCDKAYLKELAAYCKAFAIEVIPEIEVPAHGYAFLSAYPQYICDVPNAHAWAMCFGDDTIWEKLEALVGEIVEIFPESEYVHVGSDELEFADLEGPSKRLCHWDDCPKCTEMRRREGLADRREQFYYVMQRMKKIVTSHGKKMIMWNDQLDSSKEISVDRDILQQFWRIAGRGRGPYEGCTMDKLAEAGFRMINSFYGNTYLDIDHYLTAEKLKKWTPYDTPHGTKLGKDAIVGGEMCAWEFGNVEEYPHYPQTTPPSLALFADKLWSIGTREYTDEYLSALGEFVFGATLQNDLFACFGSPIPPRKKDAITYVDAGEQDFDRVDACRRELSALPQRGVYGGTVGVYRDLLQKIYDERG